MCVCVCVLKREREGGREGMFGELERKNEHNLLMLITGTIMRGYLRHPLVQNCVFVTWFSDIVLLEYEVYLQPMRRPRGRGI